MSKSTRLSAADLEAMNLEEYKDGLYRPKNSNPRKESRDKVFGEWLNTPLPEDTKEEPKVFGEIQEVDIMDLNMARNQPEYKSQVISNDTHLYTGNHKSLIEQAGEHLQSLDESKLKIRIALDALPKKSPEALVKAFMESGVLFVDQFKDADIKITVKGDPKPQQRHRHHQVKGSDFVTTYDPSSKDKKEFLKKCLPYKPYKPIDGPISLSLTFYCSRPKSHYRTGKYSHLLKDNAPEWKTSTPDIDNYLKFCQDALNKVFWKDDSCIVQIGNMGKKYSDNPRTEISITIL